MTEVNETYGCILSKFYIKPQLAGKLLDADDVVSYRNSTSNHNNQGNLEARNKLYLIEILHQTTTRHVHDGRTFRLYLIEILHQTTTVNRALSPSFCCILSKFYIKPQHTGEYVNEESVVSYRNSTSNHNNACVWSVRVESCILSKFYIKPQL